MQLVSHKLKITKTSQKNKSQFDFRLYHDFDEDLSKLDYAQWAYGTPS